MKENSFAKIMRRMLSIIMLLFFLMSVSGVNVNIHYCDSELVGMTVNGIHFKTEAGQKMADCCNENTGCPMCKQCRASLPAAPTIHAKQHATGASFAPGQRLVSWRNHQL